MNRLIQCKNLTLQYDRHIAVQNVSFSVEPGDFLCIIGENGSGTVSYTHLCGSRYSSTQYRITGRYLYCSGLLMEIIVCEGCACS